MYHSQKIDKESEETTIVGMNNANLVDGNVIEMDYTKILQQHTVSEMKIDQHNCTRNINIQYYIEGREYRSNYQREYKKRHHEKMNDIERECQRLNRNQQERKRSEGEYRRREQDQSNETKGEIQILYHSKQIVK